MSGDSPAGDATQSSGPLEGDRPPLSKDVFVSYASQDAAVANSVVEALEGQDIRCWIAPRDVTPGEFYADAIVHAIDAAQALVLVLSEHAAVSHHILREVERASSKRHPVISLRIDRAALPAGLEYFLNTSQWLDASEGEPSRVFPRLVEAVRKVLGGSTTGSGNASASMPPLESMHVPRRRSSRAISVVLGFMVVALLGFAIDRLWFSKHAADEKPVAAAVVPAAPISAPEIPEKSVAILPFVDMSEKKDQEYFSDGLSEELIDKLAHSADLKVIARTSSFQFKGKSEDMRVVGQKLGVANLLEGSVRTSGKTLRVTAQLIKVSDGSHLWSESYDRKMGDIFNIQDEIAGAVVKALKVSLLERRAQTPSNAPKMKAYTLFLQGRSIYQRSDNEKTTETAISYLREAVDADPTFADAWAHYSFALDWKARNWPSGQYETLAAGARGAAERALSLDPLLGNAHRAAAAIRLEQWDWVGAFSEFKQGYDLDPGNPGAARTLAELMFTLRTNDEEALRLYKKAIDLDPLYAWSYWSLANAEFDMGEFRDAEVTVHKAIDSNMNLASGLLAAIFVETGKRTEALPECFRVTGEVERANCLALVYQALGRKAEADASLAQAERLATVNGPYQIAELHAYRGETNQAFDWLDRAYIQHDGGLQEINRDLLLSNLKSDPRYKAFLVKLKLPE